MQKHTTYAILFLVFLCFSGAVSAAAPVITNNTTSPSPVYTNQTWTCAGIYFDADGDDGNMTFNLSVNGVIKQTQTFTHLAGLVTSTLAPENYTVGDNLTCFIYVIDNTSATSNWSTTVTVANLAPYIMTRPTVIYVNSGTPKTYEFNVSDADITEAAQTAVWSDNDTHTTIDSSWGVATFNFADHLGNFTVKVNVSDGIAKNVTTFTVNVNDTTAPVTSASAVTDRGAAYTFGTTTTSSDITVSLSCADGGFGCNETFYCVDIVNTCTPTTAYTLAVHVKTVGTSYIRYKSNDSEGNMETAKSSTIKLSVSGRPGTGGGGIGGPYGYLTPDQTINVTAQKQTTVNQSIDLSSGLSRLTMLVVGVGVVWFCFIKEDK